MVHYDLDRLGDRIKLIRDALDLNQTDFARRCNIGIGALNQYESGVTPRPKIEMAQRICQATGATMDWIYNGNPAGMPLELWWRMLETYEERPIPPLPAALLPPA